MANDNQAHGYDDIIDLPHHVSATRPRMPTLDRAAQFAPFAALTGYGAAIAETGRQTEERIELDEQEKAVLDGQLCMIRERIRERPVVTLTYFQPDERKAGGAYVSETEPVKRIDAYGRFVVLMSGRRVPIDDIVAIEIDGPPA